MSTKLTIIRGIPGSGKSTYAKTLVNSRRKHFESDMYFIDDSGNYNFNPKLLHKAHQWCQDNVLNSLKEGYDVVVSNTFTKLWELEYYLSLHLDIDDLVIEIVEMHTEYQSIHNVPKEKIEAMKQRWESIPEEWNIPVTQILI